MGQPAVAIPVVHASQMDAEPAIRDFSQPWLDLNDKTVLDAMGHPHSEALHLTERYHRRDFGHLDVQLTVDDPKVYTRPFTIKYTELFQPDTDILEAVCEENERDVKHMAKQ